MDTNLSGIATIYTEGDIYLDPVLLAEDVEMEFYTTAARYIRTFEFLEKSSRFEITQAYQDAEWSGKLDGQNTTRNSSGMTDTILRLAMNLYGAPPLKGKAFQDYRKSVDHSDTIVGAGVIVTLPTGKYDDKKLLNIGGNRTVIRPQLGVMHSRGKWTYETTIAAWCYTKNDDFWDGNELEQDPFYTIQTHLIYTYKPGVWASASIGYGEGWTIPASGWDSSSAQATPSPRASGSNSLILAQRPRPTKDSIAQASPSGPPTSGR